MYLSSHYEFTEVEKFEEAILQLALVSLGRKDIVRLLFFCEARDNEDFLDKINSIDRILQSVYGDKIPAYSYIPQPVLTSGPIGMEIQYLDECEATQFSYLESEGLHYTKVENADAIMLFISAASQRNPSAPVSHQAENAFSAIKNIIEKEGLVLSDIIRQWNYIERITEFEDNGKQRYQAFNDARSKFYGNNFKLNGYPAATGIGTGHGGIQIEVDVLGCASNHTMRIDNPRQRAAYDYSHMVLIGDQSKTTPKFERARYVNLPHGKWIYVSGTAAIRGELSVEHDASIQTHLTLENIQTLLSRDNLYMHGQIGEGNMESARIYVKKKEDFPRVKHCLEKVHHINEVIYLMADICRDSLLVEIEGMAGLSQS